MDRRRRNNCSPRSPSQTFVTGHKVLLQAVSDRRSIFHIPLEFSASACILRYANSQIFKSTVWINIFGQSKRNTVFAAHGCKVKLPKCRKSLNAWHNDWRRRDAGRCNVWYAFRSLVWKDKIVYTNTRKYKLFGAVWSWKFQARPSQTILKRVLLCAISWHYFSSWGLGRHLEPNFVTVFEYGGAKKPSFSPFCQ